MEIEYSFCDFQQIFSHFNYIYSIHTKYKTKNVSSEPFSKISKLKLESKKNRI